jgi:hypothetical protein
MADILLEKSDVIALAQAMNEVCNGPEAIGPEEFDTRMGVTRSEALNILAKVKKKIAEAKSHAKT